LTAIKISNPKDLPLIMATPNNTKNCSNAIVTVLENHGVTHVFGIPGAKIDSLFIALKHSKKLN
jgi:hypothetical protein